MNEQQNFQLPAGVRIEDQPYIECNQCGGHYFQPCTSFKKVSKVLLGQPMGRLVQIPVLRCMDCGTPMGYDELEKNIL